MPLLAPPEPLSLNALARLLDAQVVGDGAFTVRAVAHPDFAPHRATLALALDQAAHALLHRSHAGAAVVAAGMEIDTERFAGGLAVAGRHRVALATLTRLFAPPLRFTPGVHASAVVDPAAKIGAGASVGPLCVIGPEARVGPGAVLLSQVTLAAGAEVGAGSILHPGVRIGEGCTIGQGCILHHNASVGSDGFGFVTAGEGSIESAQRTGRVSAFNVDIRRIHALGTVIVGDNVEIGASSCVDRGTLTPTRIGDGAKIDNLVQIAHNATIGENVMIAGSAGVAGSATIGDRAVIGGMVAVSDHRTVGADAIVGGMSGVARDLEPRGVYAGNPARPIAEKRGLERNLMRVGRILGRLRALAERVERLEAAGGGAADGGSAGNGSAGSGTAGVRSAGGGTAGDGG